MKKYIVHLHDYEENGKNRKIVQEEETDQIQLQVVDNVIYASLNDMYDVETGVNKKIWKRKC